VELLHCKDDAERGRLIDLSRRMRAVEAKGSVAFLVAAAVGAPTFGWVAALPPIPGLVAFWLLQRRLNRFRYPEQVLFGCLVVTQGGLAGALALAHGPKVYLLPLLVVLTLLGCIVFPLRIAALCVGFGAALMLAVGLGTDRATVEQQPFMLLYPLVVLISGGFVAAVTASLDVTTRSVATLDQLTGLPTRVALRARAAEPVHPARATGRPVALIIADPDRFKRINDTYGHATGDQVLRGVAERLREVLPAAGAAYRLGGEEFVVLLADCNDRDACAVAAEIATRVAAEPIGEVAVTISLGVAASIEGQPFSFESVFSTADHALYEVKRSGGNGLCLAAPDGSLKLYGADRFDELMAVARNGNGPAPQASGQAQAPEISEVGEGWAAWNARHLAATGNWLIRDELQRRQLLALNRRLRERAWPSFFACFAVGAASAAQYGWQILILPAVFTNLYVLTEHRLEKLRHPEFALGGAWLALQAGFMASGLMANHQMVFAAPLLWMLLIGSSAVFPPRGVTIGILYTVAIMVAVGVLEAPQLMARAPAILCFDCAVVITIGLMGAALGRSTIEYRDLAVVDQLTGLFNRAALALRVAELAHRSAQTGEVVAVLVADIDRFKQINDTHGHAVGDAVLAELGARLRANLRAFESAYRIGGEEFVVLLEGGGAGAAELVADRLCKAVAGRPLAGIPVTVSLGVATSEPGLPFDYAEVFARADLALYQAKRSGGNRAWAARPCFPSQRAEGAGGVAVGPIETSMAAI